MVAFHSIRTLSNAHFLSLFSYMQTPQPVVISVLCCVHIIRHPPTTPPPTADPRNSGTQPLKQGIFEYSHSRASFLQLPAPTILAHVL